jgi:hypothetical protein
MKPGSWVPLLVLLTTTACGAALADLRRGEESYEEARYEAAQEWLQDIELAAPGFARADRTRYFYTRGMTEYRLEHRPEALYYLAMAREFAGEDDEGLRGEQVDILARTLAELTPVDDLAYHPRPAATGEGEAPAEGDAAASD